MHDKRPSAGIPRVVVSLLLAAGFLLVGGCSRGPTTGTISGTVTYRGQPVTQGEVHLYSRETGVGAIAAIDSSGAFRVETPLRTGVYGVYVAPTRPEPGTPAPPPLLVPQKYHDLATSNLSCTVSEGENEIPLQMMD